MIAVFVEGTPQFNFKHIGSLLRLRNFKPQRTYRSYPVKTIIKSPQQPYRKQSQPPKKPRHFLRPQARVIPINIRRPILNRNNKPKKTTQKQPRKYANKQVVDAVHRPQVNHFKVTRRKTTKRPLTTTSTATTRLTTTTSPRSKTSTTRTDPLKLQYDLALQQPAQYEDNWVPIIDHDYPSLFENYHVTPEKIEKTIKDLVADDGEDGKNRCVPEFY